jgi:hypothetical protein
MFVILSGLLIALSPKYQVDILWGTGYLPVYVAWFGVAAMTAALGYQLCVWLRGRPRTLASLSVLAVAGVIVLAVTNVGDQASVLAGYQNWGGWDRDLEVSALQAGVMRDFVNGKPLLTTGADWEVKPAFFTLYAHKRVGQYDLAVRGVSPQLLALASARKAVAEGTEFTFPAGAVSGINYSEDMHNRTGWLVFGDVGSLSVTPAGKAGGADFRMHALYLQWDVADAPHGATPALIAAGLAKQGARPEGCKTLASGERWVLLAPK